MTNPSKSSNGPRATKRKQRYLEEARLLSSEGSSAKGARGGRGGAYDPSSFYESESMSANGLAGSRISRPSCLDAGEEAPGCPPEEEEEERRSPRDGTERRRAAPSVPRDEAVTYWSSGSNPDIRAGPPAAAADGGGRGPRRRRPLFARSSSFTNAIDDGRRNHSECVDLFEHDRHPDFLAGH